MFTFADQSDIPVWGLKEWATFAIVAALAYLLLKRRTRNAHPALVPSTGRGVLATCRSHYYRKTFADRWQCTECGHMPPLATPDDVLDAAIDDFRTEFDQVESYANGEVR